MGVHRLILVSALVLATASITIGTPAYAVRPDGPGADQLLFHFDDDDVVETWDDAAGRIRVHFTRAGDNAVRDVDLDEDGVPDDVALVGATYEEALAFYEDEGFRAPRSDEGTPGGDGGDGRFDVYLVDFGLAADGNWARERCVGAKCSGYMIQENDFVGYGYPSFAYATRVLASHELFHAVQAAYDANQGANWGEATAVWATERFDASLDDLEGFAYGWLQNPDRSLDQEPTGPVDSFTYGMGIVAQYFSEAYGPELIRSVWEGVEDGAGGVADPHWLAVLVAGLEADHDTTFAAAWVELATWALRAGWTSEGSWASGGLLPVIDKEVVDLPFEDDRLRVFRASLQTWSVKPGARATVAAELVVGTDDIGELEGLVVVMAARDGTRFEVVVGAGAGAAIDAIGADEVLVAVVNTLTAGESQRPGLCLGSPDEVEACVAALGGVDPHADPGAEPVPDEAAEAAVEASPETGPEAEVEGDPEAEPAGSSEGGDDGCAGGGAAPWLAVVGLALARRRWSVRKAS